MPTTKSESKPAHESKGSTTSEPKLPAKGTSQGIPKWVIILIIVVVVLYGAMSFIGAYFGNKLKSKMDKAGVKMQVGNGGKTFTYSEKGENVDLQVGEDVKIPSNFPKSVPLFPGAKVISAITTKEGVSLSMSIENSSSDSVKDFYMNNLKSNGFAVENPAGDGGFLTFKNETYKGVLSIVEQENITHVTINVSMEKN